MSLNILLLYFNGCGFRSRAVQLGIMNRVSIIWSLQNHFCACFYFHGTQQSWVMHLRWHLRWPIGGPLTFLTEMQYVNNTPSRPVSSCQGQIDIFGMTVMQSRVKMFVGAIFNISNTLQIAKQKVMLLLKGGVQGFFGASPLIHKCDIIIHIIVREPFSAVMKGLNQR